jgi:uncharacterized protein YjbI with pentapeptide repeats
MFSADLRDTDLFGAILGRVDLEGVNLTGAKVTLVELASVRSFKGAIMPDGTKRE